MKAKIVGEATNVIMENIRRANEQRFRERMRAAIKAGRGANPAEPRMVAMFLEMCHNSRRSK
jgi:hypothetical protein